MVTGSLECEPSPTIRPARIYDRTNRINRSVARIILTRGREMTEQGDRFKIDDIRHKAIIVVVGMVSSKFPPREPNYERFLVDHPFFRFRSIDTRYSFRSARVDPSKPA
jgi:hypothetical protein